MKRTNSTDLNRRRNAFAFLAGLTSLLLLLPAAGSAATASEPDWNSTGIQDTLKYNKVYKTFITDPSDGIEKKIELRYYNEELTDVLIDGKLIKKEDYRKYERIIEEAEADVINLKRETSAAREEIRRAMEELRAIDLDELKKEIEISRDIILDISTEEIEKEIQKVQKELEKIKTEIILKDNDDFHVFTEEDKAEIVKMMEEIRKDIQIDIADLQYDMAKDEHLRIIIKTDIDTYIDIDSQLPPLEKAKMLKRLEELEANTKNNNKGFPAKEIS